MFRSILIANRGEIAVRIARSARQLGIHTVAVFTDPDKDAPHVHACDEAYSIGAADNYLAIDVLLQVAQKAAVEAVHPGYGFLSENPDFARAVTDTGLTFIGPPAEAMKLMGNKRAARQAMIHVGVPVVPGFEDADADDARLAEQALELGLPVMIKAAAGGGGRGMRLVSDAHDLLPALASARAEAQAAFGNDELLLEKAVIDARHIEVQILADAHGKVVHLYERDCSVQRRHQKIIEESPAPTLSEQQRASLAEAALKAVRTTRYLGAGTVEFLVDARGQFYFLEMNTRLQVEHAVTESVCQVDLVAWQFRLAAGMPLPDEPWPIHGHAIEVRLCAEDPAQNFMPCSGEILLWRAPNLPMVRCDHGLRSGLLVSSNYDSMLAKVIATGETREQARQNLCRALEQTTLLGLPTNLGLLRRILVSEAFARAQVTTATNPSVHQEAPVIEEAAAIAACWLHQREADRFATSFRNWSNALNEGYRLDLAHGEVVLPLHLKPEGERRYRIKLDTYEATLSLGKTLSPGFSFEIKGVRKTGWAVGTQYGVHLALNGDAFYFEDLTRIPPESNPHKGGGLTAPMAGKIGSINVQANDAVVSGQRLITLISMKMEHHCTAPQDGKVTTILVQQGEQVQANQPLILLEIDEI